MNDNKFVARFADDLTTNIFKAFMLLAVPLRRYFKRGLKCSIVPEKDGNKSKVVDDFEEFILCSNVSRMDGAAVIGEKWRNNGLVMTVAQYRQ